ncbi:MAG: MotA/TolQ/ExbB proton channel family protein [Verrucomicrobiota bacterium]
MISLEEAWGFWVQGEWSMLGLAGICFIMFILAVDVFLGLKEKRFKMPESKWGPWIRDPELGQGYLGDLIRFVMQSKNIAEIEKHFDEVRSTELRPFIGQLRFMKTCIAAAPLVGLLGTVIGMLVTFKSISSGSGGDQTMEAMANGISLALITTQAGLTVALPGYFVHYYLRRNVQKYEGFLAHLETQCTQFFYKESLQDKPTELTVS